MKGDFSRSTFRKEKHYCKVNMQMGRVQIDSDWNEQTDIHAYYGRTALQDIIGDSGTLNGSSGFSIIPNDFLLFNWDNVPGNEGDELKEFLEQNFGVYWTGALSFVKSPDEKAISISDGAHSLSITLDDEKTRATKASLNIDGKDVYEFIVKTINEKPEVYRKLFKIGAGRYYVDGILCENETDIDVFRQPDLPLPFDQKQYLFNWDGVPGNDSRKLKKFLMQNFVLGTLDIENLEFVKSDDNNTLSISDETHSLSIKLNDEKTKANLIIDTKDVYEFTAKSENDRLNIYYKFNPIIPNEAGTCLAYLDVWERHLTFLDDPEMAEPALGGADTTTRTKIVWQVKLLQLGNERNYSCLSPIPAWDALVRPSTGTLQARSEPQKTTDSPCILSPGAGYRGLENQLYRVEIHDPGEPAKGATFKWSRDNGAVVTGITNISGADLTVTDTGRDKLLGFSPGQWVEIIDDRHELWGIPGTLARLTDVNENTLTFDVNSVNGDPISNENYPQELNPRARRWDSAGSIPVTIPSENNGYIELEEGVQVRFADGTYKTNDYWLIPARTAKGDIEWPRIENTPAALHPEGIEHHFCRLALLEYGSDGLINLLSDCRKFFPSTTALNGLSANTGILRLNWRQGHDTLFGPFEHWLKNLSTPPAIILGLSLDNQIDFGEISQTFKAVDVNSETFKVQAPPAPERELNLELRWWAIPGQEKGIQTGKPIPSITFNPPTIHIGDSAKISVINPEANMDSLKIETVGLTVTASIFGQSGEQSESKSVTVNATETDPSTGIFEVGIQIADQKTVKVGDQVIAFDGTFESFGGSVETSYWYSVDGVQKPVTDVANIPKVGTGSVTGRVTDNKGNGILNATVSAGNINALTSPEGNYRLDNVPPGGQDIIANANGFNTATKTANVIPNQVINVDFSLTPLTGTIAGIVTDASTNNPIQGATLSVDNTSISSTTASSGKYTLSNVPVGVQTVRASISGFSPGTQSVTVKAGQLSTANFSLSKIQICIPGIPNRPCLVGGPNRPCVSGIPNRPCTVGGPNRPFSGPAVPAQPQLQPERPCSAAKPDNIRLSGKPKTKPDSFQKPEVKPKRSEQD